VVELWSAVTTHRLLMRLGTGCRMGEAMGLRWGDIDFDGRALSIERAVSRPRHATPVLVNPKSAAGTGAVQLAGQTVDALRHWKVQQAEERLRHQGEWVAEDSVVTLADGRQPTPSQLRTAFNRESGELSLPKARLHDMRHHGRAPRS
jgi:integrase